MRRSSRSILTTVVIALFAAAGVGVAAPTPAASAATPAAATFVGTRSVATPAAGGERIYVATNGTDLLPNGKRRQYCLDTGDRSSSCPAPTADRPLRTVQTAIRIAAAGDVIVVRSGTYEEQLGWGARAGSSTKPIVFQSAPGERVVIAGFLQLRSAHYWRVQGLRFTYSAAKTTGEAIVRLVGGRNWTFANNEVYGTRGVANILIREDTASNSSDAARRAAAPQNYTVAGNCVRSQNGTAAHGLNHNIYLMPTIWSSGGLIERNLLTGAPTGSNIKASGSSDANGSPRNVTIRYNTMLYSASGVITGLKSEGIEIVSNVVAKQQNGDRWDAAMKTYQGQYSNRIGFKDNLVSGFAKFLQQPAGEKPVYTARNVTPSSLSLTGSVANCSVRLADPALAAKYGVQFAG